MRRPGEKGTEHEAAALRAPADVKLVRSRADLSKEPLRNIHDYLATKLGREIVGGHYKPGDQLPNEVDLRDQLSVSRTALREAYRVLSAKGLIASRQNVGTRVRPKSDWNMLDPDVLSWHLDVGPSEEFIVALFDLRQMIEPPAAARAAHHGDPEALARITEAYDAMARSKDGEGDLIGADVRFHQEILAASQNPLIGTLGALIHTALVGSFRLGWPSAATMSDVRLSQHRDVLDAIRVHQPEEARYRMAMLLEISMDDIRRGLRIPPPKPRRKPGAR
ncbi:MAG TPA: FadR/GntR family transcriptional regulator [Magnetospirillaceae bacterium]|jgi:DNA-binding FadR family transcriptional regulator